MSNTNENQIFAFTLVSPVEGLFVHSNVIFLVILKWKKNLYVVYFK